MADSFIEKRKKQLGLSSDSSTGGGLSFVEQRKMDLGMIPDTRPKPKALEPNKGKSVAELKKTLPPQLTATNPVTSSTLMRAVNGDQAAKQSYEKTTGVKFQPSTTPKTEYQKAQEEIDKLPPGVKQFATVMNAVTRGWSGGNLLSRATNIPGVSMNTVDSTGNKTVDSAADWIGRNISPMLVPSGAPFGTGTVAGPYKIVGNLLETGKGQRAVNALAKTIPGVSQKTAQGIARGALTEGIAGTIQMPAQNLLNDGNASGRELLTDAAIGGVAGLGLGALGGGIGAALNRAGSRAASNVINSVDSVEPTVKIPEIAERTPAPLKTPEVVNQNIPPAETGIITDPLSIKTEDIPSFMLRRGANQANPLPVESQVPIIEGQAPIINNSPTKPKERGFAETLKASEKTPEEFVNRLQSEYTPINNAETVQKANSKVSKDIDEATRYVLNDSKFDATKSATAQRLIDHYNQQGNYDMAVSIADKVATEATKAGQFIQSLSIYNRLTPEGVLIRAKQIANKANEGLPAGKKGVEVTSDMAARLTELAGVTQKMTGVKGLANDVISILERAKTGEKLTSAETDALKRFVNESKQFIKETTKKTHPKHVKLPGEMKDKRVRDNVVSFLEAQEQAARERLKARGNRLSSTPLDVYADYAIIGASKLGKGIVKFADWSEEMVKEFGEDIRPYLANIYNRSEEALRISAKKITSETVSKAERLTEKVIKTKDIDPAEAESLMVLARRVSSLSGEEKRLASQDLQSILQALDNPSIWKKISTTQTMAQLLNPKTQVRNVLGNELFYRAERLNKLLATPIDFARSKLTGSDRYVTFRTHNQGQFWKNWFEGAKAGWRGVNINGLETQFDLSGQAFRGKYNPMTYLEKSLGAALRSFDNAAYMRAYNNTLGELGTLDAINKGIKPTKQYVQDFITRADENILQIADKYGKYVTFQDNNLISRGMTTFKRGLNKATTGSIDFGAGDLILKYPKTPGALLMRAFEYSPAGFLRSAYILYKGARYAENDPAEATMALTRAIVGTAGFTGMGYYLMDNGILTGQASKDKDIRALQTSAGQGQYQVNLSALQRFVESGFDPKAAALKPNDLLYTYDWMQPVSVALSMGANINSNLKDNKDAQQTTTGALGAAFNSVAGGVNTLSEQSLLKGLNDAFSGYPGQTVTDKIVDILSDIPSSFVPTAFNQVKQLGDNYKRETYSPDKLEQTLNKAQAKIPGLAEKLPKQFDTLGQPKTHYQDNSLTNVFLNPGFASRYKLSPEAQLIVDLITETGDDTLAPRVPGKTVQGNKLTGEQFSRLSQLQGEETAKRISKIDPNKKTSTKVKKVEKALDKSGEVARKQLMDEFGLQKIK
ncbi:hypothetical protein [Paenibacillus sp. XY044]|uniref:hypothetical protein n=1 Tax=Paenibacillus sp. XY044 TaxID=2026089 RepID=UPI000B999EE3|nr:hypothetical protein [Paenibacillus sp. XY044]OZB90048.1 hypothetical protein CJP46_35300 [Paenibacillus sp. XY044]